MQAVPIPQRLFVLDSHTAGEPTRCVPLDLPELSTGSMAERLEILRERYDAWRCAILCEPRGSDVLVGAYLLPPVDPAAAAGIVFFNNAGYLGMCGHGLIGVVVTLAHMGKISAGIQRFETPVGEVEAELGENGQVQIRNVPAYRYRSDVAVTLPGRGEVRGDIAWGGNWFFLVKDHGHQLCLEHVDELTAYTWEIRQALTAQGITGADGAEIDHVELFTDPHQDENDSRNFVLCPGKVYDRSPCGTGTSAKMACLAADGVLKPGETWRQEGILSSVFVGKYAVDPEQPGKILPQVTGSAYMTGETTQIFDPLDPFHLGVPSCF